MEDGFRDKLFLSTYMLDTEIFDNFDFLVQDAEPVRSIYILTTNEGYKILKKIAYSKEELLFIYEALNTIREKYPYIINFKKDRHANPYIEYRGGIYVVFDLIEGRECLFENPIDLRAAAEALAKFHIAAENIKSNYSQRNNLNKMATRYKNKIRDLEKYKKVAQMHVNKSDFDRIYLEYVDYYMNCSRMALEQLNMSVYRGLCELKHTLCHHDLAHHNIIMGNDGNVYFVDFDYSMIDIPYHDISNMITKAAKNNGWCSEISDIIMEAYTKVSPMSEDEMEVLYGFLLFPMDFYDISSGYYLRTRDWDEDDFVEKLRRKAGYKEEREEFLRSFREKWGRKN